MKILFSTIKATSHFRPLLPFAHALKARGHDVRFAAIIDLAEAIEAEGFEHIVMAGPTEAQRAQMTERVANMPMQEAGKIYVPEFFMGMLARAGIPGLLEDLQDWRPDLVIRESTEFCGLIAAQKLGIPHVRLEIVNGESEEAIATKYADQLDALRQMVGLDPVGPGYLRDEPSFSGHPAALDDTPRINSQAPLRYLSDPLPTGAAPAEPDWMPPGPAPLVYATFGTIAGGIEMAQGIYNIALAAFAELPVKVLLTTGHDAPADLLDNIPDNVRVRPFVPQAEVLPHAQLMVCHGGSGTVVAGLAAAVPLVLTPMFADQPDNARCLAGRGLCLNLPDPTVDGLKSAITAALADDAMRARVRRAAQEIAALPSADTAVDQLLLATRPGP